MLEAASLKDLALPLYIDAATKLTDPAELEHIVPLGKKSGYDMRRVIEAIADADIVLLAPSNPVVSVGAIISVPGVRAALRTTSAPVVGISPVIGGAPLRGMADECLSVIGVETTAEAIGAHYGSRSGTGILDGWLVAPGDTADIPGVATRAVPLLMSEPSVTAQMVRDACDLVGVLVTPA